MQAEVPFERVNLPVICTDGTGQLIWMGAADSETLVRYFVTGSSDETMRKLVAVARHDVTMGTRLQRDDLAMVRMDLAPAVRSRAFASAEVLVGATDAVGVHAQTSLVNWTFFQHGEFFEIASRVAEHVATATHENASFRTILDVEEFGHI